ncbi:MAG: hypothetical protein ACSLEX_04200, partial [Minisyncoccota bacterium]
MSWKVMLVGVLFAIAPWSAFAQTPEEGGTGTPIANINLSDIHVVSPHDTQLSVTFTLTNQGSVMQTDIRYGFEFL